MRFHLHRTATAYSVKKALSAFRYFPKRSVIGGLLAALCFVLSAPASASVVYSIDATGSLNTLTGTITTDGVTGALQASDITGFNLTVSGKVSVATNSNNNGFTCQPSGCDLYVSGDQLIIGSQTTYTSSPRINFNTGISSPSSIEFVSGPNGYNGGILTQISLVGVAAITSGGLIENVQSTFVIGNAVSAVPLPGAVWLFGSGLLGLIGAARRKPLKSE